MLIVVVELLLVIISVHLEWNELSCLRRQDVSGSELERRGLKYSLEVEVGNENEGIQSLIGGISVSEETGKGWS